MCMTCYVRIKPFVLFSGCFYFRRVHDTFGRFYEVHSIFFFQAVLLLMVPLPFSRMSFSFLILPNALRCHLLLGKTVSSSRSSSLLCCCPHGALYTRLRQVPDDIIVYWFIVGLFSPLDDPKDCHVILHGRTVGAQKFCEFSRSLLARTSCPYWFGESSPCPLKCSLPNSTGHRARGDCICSP